MDYLANFCFWFSRSQRMAVRGNSDTILIERGCTVNS